MLPTSLLGETSTRSAAEAIQYAADAIVVSVYAIVGTLRRRILFASSSTPVTVPPGEFTSKAIRSAPWASTASILAETSSTSTAPAIFSRGPSALPMMPRRGTTPTLLPSSRSTI